MPVSSKFLTESTGEKIVKISQYLAKIWTKNDSLVFWATLYSVCVFLSNRLENQLAEFKG